MLTAIDKKREAQKEGTTNSRQEAEKKRQEQ